MTRPTLFAANWKMHLSPGEARTYVDRFLAIDVPRAGRTVAFFPAAVAIEGVATALRGHDHLMVGAQDVHWEPNGAFTGATSVALARGAGAAAALVGHSERRHVFGDTDEVTHRKLVAVLSGGLQAMLCVGETLEQRDADATDAVVARQLRAALDAVSVDADLVIAYEPVWAIGTGKTATPDDATTMHTVIRDELKSLCGDRARTTSILYGGSVNPGNAPQLIAAPEVDGVLVGGASLDPGAWLAIARA